MIMTNPFRRTIGLALLAGALCCGCTTRLTDFTLLSTKNFDLSKASSLKRGTARVTGDDKVFIIIFIPTGVPNVKEAVDRAIESVPGAVALVDGVVTRKGWWFIFGEDSFIVEGTPLIDPSRLGAGLPLPSKHIVSYFDPPTRRPALKYVDQATFHRIQRLVKAGDEKSLEAVLLNR